MKFKPNVLELESKLIPGTLPLIPPTVNTVPVVGIIINLDSGGENGPSPTRYTIDGQLYINGVPLIHPSPQPIGPAGPALVLPPGDGLLLVLNSGGEDN